MSIAWQEHSEREPDECSCGENPHRIFCPLGFHNYFRAPRRDPVDWLDTHEDEQDQLSRFGAFKPITWIAVVVVGCTAFYWGCVGLLWIGLRLSR